MSSQRVIVTGGGAAGFFAAITCGNSNPNLEIVLLEKGPQFLSKVRISGGGRCNVTHSCFDARELAGRFPRGGQALIGPFRKFQPRDTIAWFESRGVKLKTEADGRMFPVTDSSQTIIDCLIREAKSARVHFTENRGVERVGKKTEGGFLVTTSDGETLPCDRLLLATGGCRTPAAGKLPQMLGHTLETPVPSLFTFHIDTAWLHELAGLSIESVEASVPGTGLKERGPLLMTHRGVSGPVILRLSAWGARELHARNYTFPLVVNWLPQQNADSIRNEIESRRVDQPARLVVNSPIPPIPLRLWEKLVVASGLDRTTRCAALSRAAQHRLTQQLMRTELPVIGKTLNKDEFVTCGGVPLSEIDFNTMGSRVCPGLFFAGELLDIDGITGGFNFQAAWTTGWLAGRAMARDPARRASSSAL